MQGAGAAEEIARTLALADRRADCDVLILTRGGGSLEDLWSFNEEVVARAIAAVKLPIIVGVGHEIDFTIADFVADLRAPTPSQAAELAVPDQREWLKRFARLRAADRLRARGSASRRSGGTSRCSRTGCSAVTRACSCASARSGSTSSRRGLRRAVERRIETRKLQARAARDGRRAREPRASADARARALAHRARRLAPRVAAASRAHAAALEARVARASTSLSPLATLERGYAIVTDAGGKVLTDSGDRHARRRDRRAARARRPRRHRRRDQAAEELAAATARARGARARSRRTARLAPWRPLRAWPPTTNVATRGAAPRAFVAADRRATRAPTPSRA